jgi:NADPH2:quinone reductase
VLTRAGMKAAVYYQNGGPEVLRYEDVPDPTCPEDRLLIRNEAISIEGGDTVNRWGGPLPSQPHIVGYQAAGEVIEVGAQVQGFTVGQKVVTTGAFGSHAELRVVHPLTAWPVPRGMDICVAAAVPIAFGTADNCLFEYGRLQAGGTALIQAGASGVGIAAIQLAKRAGALVLATASSDERLERLKEFGLDHGINHKTEDVVKAVMRITNKRGADVALDGNGGASLQASVRSLGWKGRVTFIGVSGREGANIDVGSLIGGNRSLIGLALGLEMTTPRVRASVARLLDEVARAELKVVLDREFPLAEAANAHAYIESRRAVGRVLLIP